MNRGPTQVEAKVRSFPLAQFLAVTLLAAFLCFFRLGSRAMWQDEGETAVLAQSVLRNGIPLAKLGENVVLQDAAAFDAHYLWTFHPWGQFYLTAASFAVFGQSDLTARLPFALCGVATVAMLFLLSWRWWKSASLATVAALLLPLSATFIVHARQCRYYAPDALACLCITAAWIEVLRRPDRIRAILLGLGIAFQFYVDFGTLIGIAPGLLVLLGLLRPQRKAFRNAGIGTAIGTLLCLPGAIFHARRFLGGSSADGLSWSAKVIAHLSYVDGWFVPLIILLIAGIVMAVIAARQSIGLTEQHRLGLGLGVLVLVAAVVIAIPAPIPHVRYLIALMPLAKLVLASAVIGFYRWVSRASRNLATGLTAILVLMLVTTNLASSPIQLFAFVPDLHTPDFCTDARPHVRSDLAGLLYELTHDFESPDAIRLREADALAKSGEVVLVNYGDLPLMFHRPDLIVRGGVSKLGLPIDDHGKPDLILLQAHQPIWFREELARLVGGPDYVRLELDAPDALYGNIPEPRAHWYRTPAQRSAFLVFLRADHWDRLSATTRGSS